MKHKKMNTHQTSQIKSLPNWLVEGVKFWYWDLIALEPVQEVWQDTENQRCHYLHLDGQHFQTKEEAIAYGASLTKLNVINTSFLLPKPWKSMETAPKDDTEIWILAMEIPAKTNDQLPYVIRKTSYHPDAGYTICGIRREIAWCHVSDFDTDVSGEWNWVPTTNSKITQGVKA